MISDKRVEQLLATEYELYELREALRPFAELAMAAEIQRKGGDQYAVVVVPIAALKRAAELVGTTQ